MKILRKQDSKISDHEIAAGLPMKMGAGRGRWSTAFLMGGAALLGATAVALWNRRTIANMRIRIFSESAKPQQQVNTDEEIF